MERRLALAFERFDRAELKFCRALNRSTRSPAVRNLFKTVSWLGDGWFWYGLLGALLALLLLVFTIGLFVGEEIRDLLYGEPISENEQVLDKERIPGSTMLKKGKKWRRYSGLFVLLKQKWSLSVDQKNTILTAAFHHFLTLVQPNVPT